jgi:glycosyltransferase involved in cell wall biosynthesis
MHEKTALLLVREYPYPTKGGDQISTHAYIRALRDLGYTIDLITYDTSSTNLETESFRRIARITKPSRLRPFEMLRCAVMRDSYLFRRYSSSHYKHQLHMFLKAAHYDVVFVVHSYMLQVFPYSFRQVHKPNIFLSTEVMETFTLRAKAALQQNKVIRFFINIEAARCQKREIESLTACKHVFFYSKDEANWYRQISGSDNGNYIPLGLDLEKYIVEPRPSNSPFRVAYYGNYSWYPNEDGLRYLLEEIWPVLAVHRSDVVLEIAGRKLPRWTERFLNIKSIRFVGEVDSIEKFISQSDIVLAPIRIGGGIRLKILEAMALGRPVIATSVAMEGNAAVVGSEILVANSADEYSSQVDYLLSSSKVWHDVANAARSYINRVHDYKVSVMPHLL